MAAYIRAQKREEKKARKEKKGKGKEKDEKKKRKHEGETKEERAARKREKKEKKEGKRSGSVLKLENGGRDRSQGPRSVKREPEDQGSSSRHRDDYSRDRERRYREVSPPRRRSPSIGRRGSPRDAVKVEPETDWRAGRQETLGRHDGRDLARDRDVERDRSYRQRDADRTMRQMDRSRDDRADEDRRYDRDRRPDERDRGQQYNGRPSRWD